MPRKANIVASDNLLVVSGELVFQTVMTVWEASLPLLANQSALQFDLAGVTLSNSAGVALILEWMKFAKLHNKVIKFHNTPAQLLSIISVSGLETMLKPVLS
jgi:phospholipid transport system transporter-binding protein